jgi:hypothetical protein
MTTIVATIIAELAILVLVRMLVPAILTFALAFPF